MPGEYESMLFLIIKILCKKLHILLLNKKFLYIVDEIANQLLSLHLGKGWCWPWSWTKKSHSFYYSIQYLGLFSEEFMIIKNYLFSDLGKKDGKELLNCW